MWACCLTCAVASSLARIIFLISLLLGALFELSEPALSQRTLPRHPSPLPGAAMSRRGARDVEDLPIRSLDEPSSPMGHRRAVSDVGIGAARSSVCTDAAHHCTGSLQAIHYKALISALSLLYLSLRRAISTSDRCFASSSPSSLRLGFESAICTSTPRQASMITFATASTRWWSMTSSTISYSLCTSLALVRVIAVAL